MNAVSGSILVILLAVVCLAPRRWALLGIMAGVFFLTQGHSVVVAGLNLYPIRILGAVAFGRAMVRGELVWSRLNKVDWAVLLLYNYAALVWILRSSHVGPQQFASGLDPTVFYLAVRAMIASLEELRWFLNSFVGLLVPFTALVLVERLTGRSAFTLVGHDSELLFRDGRARCEGSFRHAILLGSVAASFLSQYIGLWLASARRTAALLGGVTCLALVILTNSGGPVTTTAAVALGWAVWSLRARMLLVRHAALGLLVVVFVFMKAPIWYLPYKISGIVGGGGYHRGMLMDQAWQHLDKWWMAGMEITDTASWLPYVHDLFGGVDVTNQYLAFGIRAGLPAVALMLILLSLAFRGLGRARAAVHGSGQKGRPDELLLWGLGVALFAHAVSWWDVAYFDQSNMVWLLQLVSVSGAMQEVALRARVPASIPVSPKSALRSDRHAGASIRPSRRTSRKASPRVGRTAHLRRFATPAGE